MGSYFGERPSFPVLRSFYADGRGRGHLTDFGIALMLGESRKTKTGSSLGTPHYMSPEQIRNSKGVDHRTDVYGFGCVLFEMVTGRPPFLGDEEEGDTDFLIKSGHVNGTPPVPSSLNPRVPPALDDALRMALEKDPSRRFQGCGAFAGALAGMDPGP